MSLSPGDHNNLAKDAIEEFAPRFTPGAKAIYVGDTQTKNKYMDKIWLANAGITLDKHGKMPDVVLHYEKKDWLLLVECVVSHGPADAKRFGELMRLFEPCQSKLVLVSAFPDRSVMGRHLQEISWETVVWCADSPSHVIYFNGDKLSPHLE